MGFQMGVRDVKDETAAMNGSFSYSAVCDHWPFLLSDLPIKDRDAKRHYLDLLPYPLGDVGLCFKPQVELFSALKFDEQGRTNHSSSIIEYGACSAQLASIDHWLNVHEVCRAG
jgi:hypothetical protein